MRKLTDSEVATILHGLRLVQEHAGFSEGDCHKGTCEHFDDAAMPSMETIDELCEALNIKGCCIATEDEMVKEAIQKLSAAYNSAWFGGDVPVKTPTVPPPFRRSQAAEAFHAGIHDAVHAVPYPLGKPVSESGHEDDQPWPFCDGCRSYHHPKNPTCFVTAEFMAFVATEKVPTPEEFKATRYRSGNAESCLMYEDLYIIERISRNSSKVPMFYLRIENQEWTEENLQYLQVKLFQYARRQR